MVLLLKARQCGGKNKNPPEIPAGSEKRIKFVQKSRRRTMPCHAMRFSAATAIIGLVGFMNISMECCVNCSNGSMNLRHKFLHRIISSMEI
jgi:hypothetical protein